MPYYIARNQLTGKPSQSFGYAAKSYSLTLQQERASMQRPALSTQPHPILARGSNPLSSTPTLLPSATKTYTQTKVTLVPDWAATQQSSSSFPVSRRKSTIPLVPHPPALPEVVDTTSARDTSLPIPGCT